MVEQKFSLELTKNGVQQTIHAKEGEAHARALKITFTVKGEVIPITGYAVTAYFEDGTHQNLTNSGNPLTFEIPAGLCESPGEKLVEIQFTRNEGTEKVYSPQFRVTVEDSIGATAEGGAIGDPTQFEKLLASDTEVQSPTVSAMVPLVESDATKLISASYFASTDYVDTGLAAKADTSDVTSALANKVDKVDGKGLSTNDYTTAEKTKLEGIDAGAEVNLITDVQDTSGNSLVTNKIAKVPLQGQAVEIYNSSTGSSKYKASEIISMMDNGIVFVYKGHPVISATNSSGTESVCYIKNDNLTPKVYRLLLSNYIIVSDSTLVGSFITSTQVSNITNNTSARHTHSNKTVLDKFGESSGTPTYDGNPIGGGGAVEDVQDVDGNSLVDDGVATIPDEVIELKKSYQLAYTAAELNTMWLTKVLKIDGNLVVGITSGSVSGAIAIYYIQKENTLGGEFYLYYDEYDGTDKHTISTLNKVGVWSEKSFTATEKIKLSGIATGAEVNVIDTIKDSNGNPLTVTSKSVTLPAIPAAQIQSDWDQSDNTAKDYIKNKPTIPTAGTITSGSTGYATGGDVYTVVGDIEAALAALIGGNS